MAKTTTSDKLSIVDQLDAALKLTKIKIKSFNPDSNRGVGFHGGGSSTVEKLAERIREGLKADVAKYPELLAALYDHSELAEVLMEFAEEKGLLFTQDEGEVVIPEEYKDLTLNIDAESKRQIEYFLTTSDDVISPVSGIVYMKASGIKEAAVERTTRRVFKEYKPRAPRGVSEEKSLDGQVHPIFNTYVPPAWMSFKGKLPDRLPVLFEKLINHLLPVKEEREYFYDWLHASLFTRAFVYLILCGAGGTGKNRLKLVMRALHGHDNTVDGKKSTLTERFNSQLADATLAWFDELHYDLDMENAMKELQNDSISIERKGIDATRSTQIYASLVISNNKPRDNYIALDARKFVPLQVANSRLETAMTSQEIDQLTLKVENWKNPEYDIAFVAQIGRWLQKRGNKKKYPHLEYKGPMFYKLAHTSMSRWQKKAAHLMLSGENLNSSRIVFDHNKGYLWSTIAEQYMKKNGDRTMQFPDFTTVKHFFDIFVDAKGKPAFKTFMVPKDIMSDFYVKLLNPKAHIMTESEVLEDLGDDDGDEEEIDPEEYEYDV